MTGETGPGVWRRELGARLRQLRAERGLTIEEVAEYLLCSTSKISRLEGGLRAPGRRDVRDLLQLYEVADTTEGSDLLRFAQEGRRPNQWGEFDVSTNVADFAEQEQAAATITVYASNTVPVLFQTDAYSRAQLVGAYPGESEDFIAKQLRARIVRRTILTRDGEPPTVLGLLDEAAVRRCVGDADVMRAQADRLLQLNELENVTILVIPFSSGAHPGIDTNFTFLTYPGEFMMRSTAVTENLVGQVNFKRKKDLDVISSAVTFLREAACNRQDSARLIAESWQS